MPAFSLAQVDYCSMNYGKGLSAVDESQVTVAVIIPCFNEEMTVGKVCDDFRRELPDATVYVYDNNSTDSTAAIAAEHGAVVRSEYRQGKGHAMRQAFRDIDADIYVMVDGDDTYPAESVHDLIAPLLSGVADLTLGDRLSNDSYAQENKRYFHGFGNSLVRWLIKILYGRPIMDAMTGYRALSRNFVKSLPMLATGFEIEVEMDIEATDKQWRLVELPVDYRDRPEGSVSKLSTVRDGVRVLATVMSLFKDYKPLIMFSILGLVAFLLGMVVGIPVIVQYFNTGLVPRFPSAILAVALCLAGMLSFVCGVILDTVVKASRKQYELTVLAHYKRVSE